jgi:flagellar motor protein MotB
MKKLPFLMGVVLHCAQLQAQCPEGLITGEPNLIANGDFEEDRIDFTTEYIRHAESEPGRYQVVVDAKTFWPGFVGTGEGKFLAVDGSVGVNKIVWQQEITVQENTLYFFSAWVSNLYTVHPAVLQFSINGVLLDQPFHTPGARNQWEQFFVNWQSGSHTRAVITLVSQNPGVHGNDFGLDRIKFYACVASSLPAQLRKVEPGKVIELRNVLFATASAEILPPSFAELDQLVAYLRENPSVTIEVAGHTDRVGNEAYNLTLSQDRANAIGKYLVAKKLPPAGWS